MAWTVEFDDAFAAELAGESEAVDDEVTALAHGAEPGAERGALFGDVLEAVARADERLARLAAVEAPALRHAEGLEASEHEGAALHAAGG